MNLMRRWLPPVLALGACLAIGLALGQSNATPPLVQLPDDPLYLNGSKSKSNLALTLSVESPTVGTTFHQAFDANEEYMGYFDPMFCYENQTNATYGEYFVPTTKKATLAGACGNGKTFDGNFLNWATSSAVDIMRYGLTGGNRVVDEGTGTGLTVLERAYLPDFFYKHPFFPAKQLGAAQIALRTPFTTSGIPGDLHIRNCRNRVYFATQNDTTAAGDCTRPFAVADAKASQLLKTGITTTQPRFYTVRVRVCDSISAGNRLMTYDPGSKRWNGLCSRYGDGAGNRFYKPVGQLQMNADNVRVAVFAYLNDSQDTRYGGVMRAPFKYLGSRSYDANFNLETDNNPYREWDPVTGVLSKNPQQNHPKYPDQGYGQSGAINYINRFGTLNPATQGVYKNNDPVSELYYETFRYLQGKSVPTPEAVSGITGIANSDRTLAENFPVYRDWADPFSSFTDSPGNTRSCMRASILAIADPYTHLDRYLPGNSVTYGDSTRSKDTNPELDIQHWTGVVGSFERNLGLPYKGSDGQNREALNFSGNALNPLLSNVDIATQTITETGARGSYLMAGLAYFANTQSFRTDLPKARIKTFVIDVNSYNLSVQASPDLRRSLQLHLAAKYGGFIDRDGSGNPFQGTDASPGPSNAAWQGDDQDARNFFLASNPRKFLDSIAEIFASQVEETHSIAGSANVQQITASEIGAVFQASFNPVSNFWSGRVRRLPITTAGNAASIASIPGASWEAARELTTRVNTNGGSDRVIVVGPPPGQQGLVAPALFQWSALGSDHKAALNRSFNGQTDTLGAQRLAYLRGDRSDEQSASNPDGMFRMRDLVLGSVVSGGLVYQGPPSRTVSGANYATFRDTHKNRTSVVFAAANDGMLHAFDAGNGREVFAYIPGFILPKLYPLSDPNYAHRPLVDATPAAGEAYFNGQWHSVVVGGVGAGGQGVYALDVTDPSQFGPGNVLWEFTDADHPALGNVIGRPHIVRLRMQTPGSGTQSYKWVAIVASGVNNQMADGRAQANAAPSIFILDLEARPTPATTWREGSNFWRIELPQVSTTMATGLLELTSIKSTSEGTLDTLVAGDLQGNVWKLDFTRAGLSALGSNGLTNLETVNAMGSNRLPFFVAKTAAGDRQPITAPVLVATAGGGKRLLIVGTGKYIEMNDNTVPVQPGASLYALPDANTPITDRSALPALQNDTQQRRLVQSSPITDGSKGWLVDFNATRGERLTTAMQLERGTLIANSLIPTGGACGDGSGHRYELNLLTGQGSYWASDLGLLGGVFLFPTAAPALTKSDATGRRVATYTRSVGASGSHGSGVSGRPLTFTLQVGRMSWRQINRETP